MSNQEQRFAPLSWPATTQKKQKLLNSGVRSISCLLVPLASSQIARLSFIIPWRQFLISYHVSIDNCLKRTTGGAPKTDWQPLNNSFFFFHVKQVVSQHNSRNFVKSRKTNKLEWNMYSETIPAQLQVDSSLPKELYNLTKDKTDYVWFTTTWVYKLIFSLSISK